MYASIAKQKCGNNWASRFFSALHWLDSATSRFRSSKMPYNWFSEWAMSVYRASLSGIKWKREIRIFLFTKWPRLKTWSNASSIHFWCAPRSFRAVCQDSSVLHPFWIAFFFFFCVYCALQFISISAILRVLWLIKHWPETAGMGRWKSAMEAINFIFCHFVNEATKHKCKASIEIYQCRLCLLVLSAFL